MKATRILMATAVAALLASPAMANGPAATTTPHHHHMMHHGDWAFESMDTNKDGTISKDEWMAGAEKKFDNLDANHDGKISKQEFAAMHEHMMDHHGDHHMAHGEWHSAPSAHGSTSMPPANNQATPTTHQSGGADGAGGWTAQ